jgi:hypothetical protein
MAHQKTNIPVIVTTKSTKINSKKNKDSKVDEVSSTYRRMSPIWEKINALLAGTRGMRVVGRLLLPQFENETDISYNIRLSRSTLTNIFKTTLTNLVGRPFSKPIALADDMPDELKELTDNIDLVGNNLDVFAKQVFFEGEAKGITHILVEFPFVDEAALLNKDEERKMKSRPYFVHISAENIIAAYAEIRGGVEFLTHVRIEETFVRQSTTEEFGEEVIRQIRVLEPGTVDIYTLDEGNVWELTQSLITSLDFIPLVTFYADRIQFQEGLPPLEDLADLNVAHWQSASDQRNVLTVARFPMLKVLGVPEEGRKNVVIGPMRILGADDHEATIDFIEPTGKGIEAGRDDINALQEQMIILGAEELIQKQITATEKKLHSGERSSNLKSQTLKFQDSLNLAFKYAAAWLEIEEDNIGGGVALYTDFELSLGDSTQLDLLLKSRMAGEISRKAYLNEMKRRNVLVDTYDIEEDQGELEDEGDLDEDDNDDPNSVQ